MYVFFFKSEQMLRFLVELFNGESFLTLHSSIRQNLSDPDVIRTRSLLIWSQTRYRCATESRCVGAVWRDPGLRCRCLGRVLAGRTSILCSVISAVDCALWYCEVPGLSAGPHYTNAIYTIKHQQQLNVDIYWDVWSVQSRRGWYIWIFIQLAPAPETWWLRTPIWREAIK